MSVPFGWRSLEFPNFCSACHAGLMLGDNLGQFGCDLKLQVASTWQPIPAKVSIPLQRGTEIAQSRFCTKLLNKTRPKGIPVKPNSLPRCFRRSQASPSKLPCAPQNSPESPNMYTFQCVLYDLQPRCLKAGRVVQFWLKMILKIMECR